MFRYVSICFDMFRYVSMFVDVFQCQAAAGSKAEPTDAVVSLWKSRVVKPVICSYQTNSNKSQRNVIISFYLVERGANNCVVYTL